MNTTEEIIEQMRIEMPFHLPDRIKPYIYEAMELYADQEKWITCTHKEILSEGNYNILLRIGGGMETIVLFKAGKGGKEIPYAHAKAYFKIPAPPKESQ